jgi:hypothetical protein
MYQVWSKSMEGSFTIEKMATDEHMNVWINWKWFKHEKITWWRQSEMTAIVALPCCWKYWSIFTMINFLSEIWPLWASTFYQHANEVTYVPSLVKIHGRILILVFTRMLCSKNLTLWPWPLTLKINRVPYSLKN